MGYLASQISTKSTDTVEFSSVIGIEKTETKQTLIRCICQRRLGTYRAIKIKTVCGTNLSLDISACGHHKRIGFPKVGFVIEGFRSKV